MATPEEPVALREIGVPHDDGLEQGRKISWVHLPVTVHLDDDVGPLFESAPEAGHHRSGEAPVCPVPEELDPGGGGAGIDGPREIVRGAVVHDDDMIDEGGQTPKHRRERGASEARHNHHHPMVFEHPRPTIDKRRAPGLLVLCSSLDLKVPFSATPAWWQLLKGLHECGASLHVTTYQGRVPETPWWTAHPNRTFLAGEVFTAARALARRLGRGVHAMPSRSQGRENVLDRSVRHLAHAFAAPRWLSHLSQILRANDGIDAVLFVSVPPNHLRGVPGELRARFRRPVLFYDGDVPASLPGHRGFDSGFRIYDGADLGEFDGVLSNSAGGSESLVALGARRTHTLYYAADPQVYVPFAIPRDIDVFFYGHSVEYRADSLRMMIGRPAEVLQDARFAVRGHGLEGIGRAEILPYLSFSRLREYVSRSRINLVVTREAHATVHASSTMRPFELAMMGACIVSSPYAGIEEWFEPGTEIVVVGSAEEAIERYRHLLAHDGEREALGAAARRRALAEHTYARRAEQLLAIVREYF